jgi:hypothetical protein
MVMLAAAAAATTKKKVLGMRGLNPNCSKKHPVL